MICFWLYFWTVFLFVCKVLDKEAGSRLLHLGWKTFIFAEQPPVFVPRLLIGGSTINNDDEDDNDQLRHTEIHWDPCFVQIKSVYGLDWSFACSFINWSGSVGRDGWWLADWPHGLLGRCQNNALLPTLTHLAHTSFGCNLQRTHPTKMDFCRLNWHSYWNVLVNANWVYQNMSNSRLISFTSFSW